jgi:PAS domain-containing protein
MEPILETLNDGVVIADDSDQILFAKAVFKEMTGTPHNGIIGRDARELYDRAEEFALAQAFHHKAPEMERSREEFFCPRGAAGDCP